MTLAQPLFFVRHGQTDWNIIRRVQGRTDIPLNVCGREQARAYGRTLRQMFAGADIDPAHICVVASPLSRTRETAHLLMVNSGIPGPMFCDARILEKDYGTWDGLTIPEIQQAYPNEWSVHAGDFFSSEPPGGETGAQLYARVSEFLTSCLPYTLIVGHLGTGLALLKFCQHVGIRYEGPGPGEGRVWSSVRQDTIFMVADGVLHVVGVY